MKTKQPRPQPKGLCGKTWVQMNRGEKLAIRQAKKMSRDSLVVYENIVERRIYEE